MIRFDLQNIGLKRGDTVAVHSSLHSIGPDAGGPDAVIDALLSVIGEEGNLIFPGFCWNYHGIYDHHHTPTEMGAIPERARNRPEFARSFHPTHSVIVHGPATGEFLSRHPAGRALCAGGPWHHIAELGGKILLIGCDHRSDSMVHVGEDVSGQVPYRNESRDAFRYAINPKGRKVKINMSKSPQCSIGFNAIELPLRLRGNAVRDGYIGRAQSQLVDAAAIIEETVKLLNAEPVALCCSRDYCRACQMQRAFAYRRHHAARSK